MKGAQLLGLLRLLEGRLPDVHEDLGLEPLRKLGQAVPVASWVGS